MKSTTKDEEGLAPFSITRTPLRSGSMKDAPSKTEARTNSEGKTTLHLAAENGYNAIVKCLLHFGAEIDTLDCSGSTALHGAIKNGRTDFVAILLEKGANINATDYEGWTALHMAAINGHEEIIRLLIQRGINLNAKINGRSSR
jgi:ankyrin repeat protein